MSDEALRGSFSRVNEKFFSRELDESAYSLSWSRLAGKYGSVRYSKDGASIVVHSVLLDDVELLDYVVLHELLHTTRGFRGVRKHRGRFNEKMRELLGVGEFKRLEERLKAVDIKQRNFRRRYLYSCQGCGRTITRKKRAGNISCAKCDSRYNPKYRLKLVEAYKVDHVETNTEKQL